MTNTESPSLAARLVVGSLATLGLLVAGFVALVAGMFALLVGVPLWLIALCALAAVGGLLTCVSRMRRPTSAT